MGVTGTTSYQWKATYSELDGSEAKRVRALEDESPPRSMRSSRPLRRQQAPKHLLEINGETAALRLAVHDLHAKLAKKKRRACSVVGLAPSMFYYRARRREPVERLANFASTPPSDRAGAAGGVTSSSSA